MTIFDIIDIMEFDREFHDRYPDIDDVEYEDVSENECEMIETSKDEQAV